MLQAMKKTFILLFALAAAAPFSSAQEQAERSLVFSNEVRVPATSVKSQGRSSSCWCFSGISFVESEIIRLNKIGKEADYPALSEAFVINKSLHDRGIRYVRLNGHLRACPGSEGADVLEVIRKYGIVPREVYPGPDFVNDRTVFREMTTSIRGYLKAVVERRDKPLNPQWLDAFDGILAGYLGGFPPESFSEGGKTWTPGQYRDKWKIDCSKYVNIASVTDVPYGETFVLEIMDNWRWTPSLNVSLDDFVGVIDKAIDMGYSVQIAADITQQGNKRDGYATVVEEGAPYTLAFPDEETKTTPALRQALFDAQINTDDHAMHLIGRAYDQFGRKFFVVKDSQGDKGLFHGYCYMSEEYVRRSVLHILVHEDVLNSYREKR